LSNTQKKEVSKYNNDTISTCFKFSTLHFKYNNSHSCGDKYLRSVKQKLELKIAGTYCTARAAERWAQTTNTKHMRHIYLGQPDKFTVGEDTFDMSQNTDFSNTSIADKE
jgi:hypothetical protein